MKFKYTSLRLASALAILLLQMVALPASPALGDSVGPNSPRTAVNDATIGTVAWTNPGNITTPGSPYAVASFGNGAGLISNYLVGTNYGFNLPTSATVLGITVVINRSVNTYPSQIADHTVSLVYNNALTGQNKADTATLWPTTLATATYGGPADLWGTTWTPAQINHSSFGVALAARKPSTGNRSATVDYVQITVTYINPTTTTVDCGGGVPVTTYGSSITCVATVTRTTGDGTPSGIVNWSTNGSGSFSPNPCTLSGTGGSASCSVSYTPAQVGSGAHLITAAYAGDGAFSASSGSQSVTVNRRPVTVTADAQTKVYGEADPALTYQVTSGSLVPGDAFTGALTRTPGENADVYPILQGSLALSANYTLTYVGADLTILKATPTLSVTNSPVIYNGLPQAAVVVGSVPGVVSQVTYNGSPTPPTNVGVYAVAANFTPADSLNYNSLTGAPAGNFVIQLASPALSLAITPTPATYSRAGDVIEYSYVLTNTGNVPLAGPFTVTDDKVTVTWSAVASLAPGASLTCTGSYTITAQDVAAGSVTNTATASGSYAGEAVVSDIAQATVTYVAVQFTLYLPIIFR